MGSYLVPIMELLRRNSRVRQIGSVCVRAGARDSFHHQGERVQGPSPEQSPKAEWFPLSQQSRTPVVNRK